MAFSSVRCWLKGISKSTPSSRHEPSRRPKRTCRPGLEVLEDRSLLSTTVLTVAPNPGTAGQAVALTATVTARSAEFEWVQPGAGRLEQGKVTRAWLITDRLGFLQDIGALPIPASSR